MDRKLKERVTGATLLVLIAIIFIPWVLDGDTSAPIAQTELALPAPTTVVVTERSGLEKPIMATRASAPQPVAEPEPEPQRVAPEPITTIAPDPEPSVIDDVEPSTTVASARPKPEPESRPAAVERKPVVEKPAVQRPKPESEPAPRPTPAPVATDPTSGWAVQVGSFSSQANANKLTEKLVGLQYKAFVSRKSVNGRVWYRVRVGPRTTRAEAVELSKRLKGDAQAVAIVPHPG